ncbi:MULTISPECIES: hypothetical protein [unclassified Paenibacillus]
MCYKITEYGESFSSVFEVIEK